MKVGKYYVRAYHINRDTRVTDHENGNLGHFLKCDRHTADINEKPAVNFNKHTKFSQEVITRVHVYESAEDFKDRKNELSTGAAFCSQDDDFDHRKGLLIALNRAFKPLGFHTRFFPGNGQPGEWRLLPRPDLVLSEAS